MDGDDQHQSLSLAGYTCDDQKLVPQTENLQFKNQWAGAKNWAEIFATFDVTIQLDRSQNKKLLMRNIQTKYPIPTKPNK